MTANLATKYRPQTLSDIAGQEIAKRILTNAIASQQIHNCYLFCGPKGTGKTSAARILAKSLNCQKSDKPTTTPCGECPSCKGVNTNSNIDVIEIDAASHGGVENAREIIESASYTPHGRFKVIIIDEAHQLSTTAQNCLLKTLEEPPKRTIFVLATTNEEKLLETVRSRCLELTFNRISNEQIADTINTIANTENIAISDKTINLLAEESEGSLRTTINLLEKASLMSDIISKNDIYQLLQKPKTSQLKSLTTALKTKDKPALIEILKDLKESSIPPENILKSLLEIYKQGLINNKPVGGTLETLFNCQKQLNYATDKYLWLEITLLTLATE